MPTCPRTPASRWRLSQGHTGASPSKPRSRLVGEESQGRWIHTENPLTSYAPCVIMGLVGAETSVLTLITNYRSGDTLAFNELLNRYGGLIENCCKKYYYSYNDFNETRQVARIAFWEAVDAFQEPPVEIRNENYNANHGFGRFAKFVINRKLIEALKTDTRKKNMLWHNYYSIDPLKVNNGRVNNGGGPDGERDCASQIYLPVYDEYFYGDCSDVKAMLAKLQFSKFETRCLELLAEEYSYIEIAAFLDASRKQVDNAIQRVRRKCKAAKDLVAA